MVDACQKTLCLRTQRPMDAGDDSYPKGRHFLPGPGSLPTSTHTVPMHWHGVTPPKRIPPTRAFAVAKASTSRICHSDTPPAAYQ
ncbi:hypothetical protein BraRD5C2_40200 [Bradyrhizobium sp. RD5-C2]|nr:hypothetical protein BraRD5C2_40200 [Bradyrhizobium sp. RD5-C2]